MSAPVEQALRSLITNYPIRDFWLSLETVLRERANAALSARESQVAMDLRWQAETVRMGLLDAPQTSRLSVRWRPPGG